MNYWIRIQHRLDNNDAPPIYVGPFLDIEQAEEYEPAAGWSKVEILYSEGKRP